MTHAAILATDEGLIHGRFDDTGFTQTGESMPEAAFTSVTAIRDIILAGTRDGIYRSNDQGVTWSASDAGLAIRHVRWLKGHPHRPGLIFAGTEPAGIYVSYDDGLSWTPRPEVEALRDELGWWLPYSPEAGCVRGLAFQGRRGYAAVEVGGVLRSDNHGATWNLAPGSTGIPKFREPEAGFVHADVHSVESHPSGEDLVFAATNAGLYRSKNAGETWEHINADGYTRAVWIDPDNAQHILSGPAGGVGRDGTVVETQDGGMTWTAKTDGLDAPWPNTMVERFSPAGDDLLAVLDDGRVCRLDTQTGSWAENVVPGVVVHAVTGYPQE